MQLNPEQFRKHFQSQTKSAAAVGIVFGFVFFGIGISVMVFMWTESGFHAPPLFFRIVATLIAIPFVAIGAATAYASFQALRGAYGVRGFASEHLSEDEILRSPDEQGIGQISYTCPACGAPLARDAEVSPHGDVRCAHCGRWFNIHKTGA